MAQARQGDTVKVHYTGRLADGTVFDCSQGGEPLEFTLGEGRLIPGFEQAVLGMEPGQTRTAEIPADSAYGPRRPELVFRLDRELFPPHIEPEPGLQLRLGRPDGSEILALVAEVTEDAVTLDANHPLAGQDLFFEIELVGIGPAAG